MKTKNLLKVLSLAVLLGGLAKVSSFSDFRSSGSELFLESTQGTDMFDDCQEGLRLQGPHRAQETGDLLASDVKVQVSNIDRFGNRSIRYVAAISSLAVDASFERTIYNEDGSVFAESSVKAVQYAYESIIANGEEVLPSSFGEGYNYFIVYTLGNVPESHWFHRIDVSVSVNEEESSRQANVEGLMSNPSDQYFDYLLNSETNEYQVRAKRVQEGEGEEAKFVISTELYNESLTEVEVSEYYKTYNDLVATNHGRVTGVAEDAFLGCTYLQNVKLPESIASIGTSAFEGCSSLTTLTLPSGLKTVGTDAFEGLSSLKDIYYNAANLQTTDLEFEGYENLYIGKSVESIPVRTFSSGKYNVSYDGTKEEWSNVSVDATNAAIYGQYSDSIVICDDTEMFTISLFFEGATLEVNGKVYSDECSFEVPENTKFTGVSDPSGEGLAFSGWYDGPGEDASKLTMPSESSPLRVHSDLTYYARLLEVSASGGLTPDTAIELEDNALQTQTFNLSESAPNIYLKFTPKVSDIYYIRNLSEGDFNDQVDLYSDVACSSSLSYSYNGAGNNKFFLGYELEANKTYYYKLGPCNTGNYGSDGEIILKFYSRTGDHKEEAIALTANSTVHDEFAPKARLYYSYTPSVDEKFSFKATTIGSLGLNAKKTYYLKLYLHNITDGGYDTAYTFSSTKTEYKGTKTAFLTLAAGKQYVFEVWNNGATSNSGTQQNGTDFSFTFTTTAA